MALIELVEVVSYDPKTGMLRVRGLGDSDTYQAILSGSYAHAQDGAFAGAIPEEGTWGYVLKNIDKGETTPVFTVCRTPYSFAEGYLGGRPGEDEVSQGDYIIKTNGGAKILVKKDGTISISSGDGIASRVFSGRTNTITDLCSTYRLDTAGGYVMWKSDDKLPISTGVNPVTFTLGARRMAIGGSSTLTSKALDSYEVVIELGALYDKPTGIARIRLMNFAGMIAQGMGVTGNTSALTSSYSEWLDTFGNIIEEATSRAIKSIITSIQGLVYLGGSKVDISPTQGNISGYEQAVMGNTFVDTVFIPHTHKSGNPGSLTSMACNAAGVPLTATSPEIIPCLSMGVFLKRV